MTKTNIKASNSNMYDKQFILCDFFPEFNEIHSSDEKSHFGCDSIANSLFVSSRKGKMYFKSTNVRCPECKSRNIVKNNTFNRKSIF